MRKFKRKKFGGAMVIIVGNGYGDVSSNLDDANCISYNTNTIGKGMNLIILPLLKINLVSHPVRVKGW